MKINCLNISFGKQVVGEFTVKKSKKGGKTEIVPVKVYRLEEKDYQDSFSPKNTKRINMGNCFEDKRPTASGTAYVIEKKSNGKLLGAAECVTLKKDLHLSTIGTSKNENYSGIGRALIAGILQDIRGKYKELIVPTALPSAYGFYEKCHFDYSEFDDTYYLDNDNYDKVILDAKRL